MPGIDLRKLLNHSLVANSNEPVRTDANDKANDKASDKASADTASANQPPPIAPRPGPLGGLRTGPPEVRPPPRAQPPARMHRALRPRRRS